jgi:hypothetical protein
MTPGYWILDDEHNAVETDLETWGRFFQSGARTVRREDDIDGVCVSTVFLGMDHGFDDGPPTLFETMVFRGPLDEHQWRYATWDEAVAGHERIVQHVRAGTDPDDD